MFQARQRPWRSVLADATCSAGRGATRGEGLHIVLFPTAPTAARARAQGTPTVLPVPAPNFTLVFGSPGPATRTAPRSAGAPHGNRAWRLCACTDSKPPTRPHPPWHWCHGPENMHSLDLSHAVSIAHGVRPSGSSTASPAPTAPESPDNGRSRACFQSGVGTAGHTAICTRVLRARVYTLREKKASGHGIRMTNGCHLQPEDDHQLRRSS